MYEWIKTILGKTKTLLVLIAAVIGAMTALIIELDNLTVLVNKTCRKHKWNCGTFIKKAPLNISSNPEGATVYITDVTYGQTGAMAIPTIKKTPVKDYMTEIGNYLLQFEKEGYEDKSKTITVGLGSNTEEVPLQRLRVALIIETGQPGSTILIDNKFRGNASADGTYHGEIYPGRHDIEVRKQGFQPSRAEKKFIAPETGAIDLQLSPVPSGQFSVVSNPTNADVLIDGHTVGSTPHTGKIIAGTHTLTVSRNGYEPYSGQFTVNPGETIPPFTPTLTRIDLYVEENENTREATIFYNDCRANNLDACLRLALAYEKGTHGLPQERDRAFKLYQDFCDNRSYQPACNNLGVWQARVIGGQQGPREAYRLFNHACTQAGATGKSMRACANLGYCYEQGLGVHRDPQEAFERYRQACNGRDPSGCYLLAKCYEEGRCNLTHPDLPQAITHYRRAYEYHLKGADSAENDLHE